MAVLNWISFSPPAYLNPGDKEYKAGASQIAILSNNGRRNSYINIDLFPVAVSL